MNQKGDNMLNIVAPINSIEEITPVINAGADEIYFGYLDKAWADKYSAFTGNRRENFVANITDEMELAGIVEKLKSTQIDYAITLNDRYTNGQYEDLHSVLEKFVNLGVENIIVADVGLVLKVLEWGYPFNLQISTGGGTFNHLTASFYKSFSNVKRIILPRQLTIEEINALATDDIQYEIFGIYGKDPFIDAFCRFHHGINECIPNLGPCGCMRVNEATLYGKHTEKGTPYKCLNTLYVDGCAACSLPKVNHDKIGFIKVVGRSAKTSRKLEAISMMKNAILISNIPYDEAVKMNKENFKNIYKRDCQKNNCYFAE